MAIVKQFEDPEFLIDYYKWVDTDQLKGSHFYWGLGDDGELYARCSRFADTDHWYPTVYLSNMYQHFKLKYMKKLVKEFGHLVVFL
jgi:hypothetical protein